MARDSQNFGLWKYKVILQRRWLPASAAFLVVFIVGAVAIALTHRPQYAAEGQLRFTKVNPISKLTNLGTEIGNLDPLDIEGKPLETEAAVIQSTPILQDTLAQLAQSSHISLSLADFRRKLAISEVKGTDILRVTYRATDPGHAATAVNTLMAVYLDQHIRDNREAVETASRFISARLPKSEAAVREAEAALRRFKQENQIVDLANREKDAETKITTLQGKISDAQAQIAQLQTESNVLSRQLGMTSQQAMAAVSLSQSAEIQAVLTQLQQKESQLALQSNQLTPTHPAVLGLRQDVNKLRRLFQQRVQKVLGVQLPNAERLLGALQQDLTADLVKLEASKQGLISQVITLSRTLETYQRQLSQFPRLAEKQRELERKRDATQSTYALLLQKQQEVQAEADQEVGNAKVLVPALVPTVPVSRGESAYAAVGLLGVLAFLATAYGLETLDQSIRTVEDALQQFEYPLLGVIPLFGHPSNPLFYDGELQQLTPRVFLRDFPDSPVSDAFRMLQVSLKSLQRSHHCQTLVVTSTLPQEGKSTVVANLALALAQTGSQVLVVDGNLRNPFQDCLWQVPNELGLSNILLGQADLQSATQSVSTHVDVIPAGSLHASAVSAVESKQMTLMLKAARSSYDYVLIDAPSLNAAADVSILGGKANGIMIVVKPGTVNLPHVSAAKELLVRSGQRVIGLVINGAAASDRPYTNLQRPPVTSPVAEPILPPEGNGGHQSLMSANLESPLLVRSEWSPLDDLPLRDLQDQVDYLRTAWMRSAQFVDDQEEELLQLRQTVAHLQAQIRGAGDYTQNMSAATELMRLELQLAHEKERLRLFEETLAGQRRRLESQQAVFQHHLGVLQQRIKRIVGHLGQTQPWDF